MNKTLFFRAMLLALALCIVSGIDAVAAPKPTAKPKAVAVADQPKMQAALVSLKAAKEALDQATADKGGHRVKAMKSVNDAIKEVEAAIEFDRTHSGAMENKK
ncbi:MAG: hypothetical protein IAF08_10190 [Rhizobacter sp.]|nr:hypothetical protein [Chlorobiales bacterium]